MNQAFGMGPMGFGSLSGLLESVDAMKKAWSNFSLPSSLAPTMDLDELDKRIADLKTVEQWLNVNLAMLRGTIQGMEIQRGTVAAIRAFGQAVAPDAGAMASAASQAAKAAQEAARAATQDAVRPSPATAQATAQATAADTEPGGGEQAENLAAKDSTAMAGTAVTPSAWWNLLQSQFQQVAQAAMTNPLAASASAATQAAAAAATAAAKRPGAVSESTAGATSRRSRSTKTGASTAKKQAASKGAGGTRTRGAATGEPTTPSRKGR